MEKSKPVKPYTGEPVSRSVYRVAAGREVPVRDQPGTSEAACDDQQSSMLQADLDSAWRAESAPEKLGELLLFRAPTGVYWEIDWYVRSRLIRHLQRRSQRPYHPAKGEAWYSHLQRLGLVCLARPSESGPVHA